MEELQEVLAFDAKRFGRRIASRRKKLKMKQTTLAEKIGISQQHMSGIELAKDRISFDIFLKLCVALKVNQDYLLGGTLRLSNVPQSVVENLQQCDPEVQELAAEIIELLRNRNLDKK